MLDFEPYMHTWAGPHDRLSHATKLGEPIGNWEDEAFGVTARVSQTNNPFFDRSGPSHPRRPDALLMSKVATLL